MNHQEILEQLPAYFDKELSISDSNAVELHLENCLECQQAYAEQSSVSALLRKEAVYFEAPSYLAQRINLALPRDSSPSKRSSNAWKINWLNAGAVVVSVAAMVMSGGLYVMQPSAEERFTEELLSNHVRSLQVDHLADVISSDRHTVKPWFNGKLDFSPTITDLSSQGFPLGGGRLDYLNERIVAVLVYRRHEHPINLYIWPEAEQKAVPQDVAPQLQSRKGFHLIRWSTGGMNYCAVSELNTKELENFVALVGAH